MKKEDAIPGNVVKILVGPYKSGNGVIRELKGDKVLLEVDPFGKKLWFSLTQVS